MRGFSVNCPNPQETAYLVKFTEKFFNGKLHFWCSDSENTVTLLRIETDNKLFFEKHVTTLFQKADCQLNALSRIHK